MVNAPQEELSKWLLNAIEPAINFYSKYSVKDSMVFAKNIQTFSNTELDKAWMVSYDVCSLFTNVPVMEAIQITADYMFEGASETQLPVSKVAFVALMKLAVVGVEFVFGGNIYKQIDGVAMGSPLGPALANIFLGFYEEKLFNKIKQPLYYKRYVDDTFVMFKDQADSKEFYEALNALHASLKFTAEEEVEGKLSFLDVLVEHENNRLITSIYRKKTFTGEYMKWSSFAPLQRKINLIKTLTWRALSICSPCNLDKELTTIKSILIKNGYPESVVSVNINRIVTKYRQDQPHVAKLCPLYIRLPWIGEKSLAFEQQIKKSVRSCFYAADVRACFTTRTLMSFNVKDSVPTLLRSKVVYQFKCLCGERYVGRTEQRLMDRVTQHVPTAIRNRNLGKILPDAENQQSAIAKHLCESKACREAYQEDWFSVLDAARSTFHLQTLEASYISSQEPSLCRHKQFVYTLKVFK